MRNFRSFTLKYETRTQFEKRMNADRKSRCFVRFLQQFYEIRWKNVIQINLKVSNKQNDVDNIEVSNMYSVLKIEILLSFQDVSKTPKDVNYWITSTFTMVVKHNFASMCVLDSEKSHTDFYLSFHLKHSYKHDWSIKEIQVDAAGTYYLVHYSSH